MKKIRMAILAVGMVFASQLLHAQTASLGSYDTDLGPVQAVQAAPDTIVSLTAEQDGLAQVPFDQLPRFGTFWLVMSGPGGNIAPFPCPPLDAYFPVYDITGEGRQFLVDGSSAGPGASSALRFGPLSTSSGRLAALTAQAGAVQKVVDMIQGIAANQQVRTMTRAMGMDVPGFGDGGDGFGDDWPGFGITYTYPTNGLWLSVLGVTNGLAYVNLHCVPNLDSVYAIMTKPDLTVPGWTVQAEVFPPDTNQNVVTFTLPMSSPTNLFIWAKDWTGIDSNGDGIPDWWIWYFYHDLSETAATLDSGGVNTLLYDYTNGLDPNIIAFKIDATNDYVNTATVGVQLDITAGTPAYYAVPVGGSTETNWLPLISTNLTVALGATDGVYDVVVGLKGLPADATQTWHDYSITLDRVAPVLTITNPILSGGAATVTKPFLQLQGLADEQLMSLSYDISNATGMATHQNAFVTDKYYDTNQREYTTNWFQAYDVLLATNVNHITLRATDRAGNTRTTNFNVTLDYSVAANPVLALTWPTNGMELCGSSFTLRGLVDDDSSAVSASITDTNGNTTTVAGVVERSGVLWVDNLPLAEGTNWITLTVTNSAGLPNATNLYVVKSDMTLTVTEIDGDLWKPPVNVHGTISEPGYAVYVNGKQGTNYGNGSWEVDDVPVSPSGVASFDVNAIPPGGGDPAINTNVVKDPEIVLVKYDEARTNYDYYHGTSITLPDTNNTVWTRHYVAGDTVGTNGWYYETNSGYSDIAKWGFHEGSPYSSDDQFNWSDTFPGGWRIYTIGGVLYYIGPIPWGSWMDTYYDAAMAIPDLPHYYGDPKAPYQWQDANAVASLTVDAQTQVKLYTGGRALSGQKNLFCISAWADEYDQVTNNIDYYNWEALSAKSVDKTKLVVPQMGSPGSDGKLWVALADNAEPYVTVVAPGKKHYNAGPVDNSGMQEYKPFITANDARLDPDAINVTNCVGQKIVFKLAFDPPLPDGVLITNQNLWWLPPKYENAYEWFLPDNGPALTNTSNGQYFLTTCDPVQTTFSRYVYSLDSPFCTYYKQASWPLTQPETGAWWISGGPKAVTCFPTLTFNNGQKASFSIQGDFLVVKPNVFPIDTNDAPFGGQISIYDNAPWLDLTSNAMHFRVYISKTHPGSFGLTQVAKMYSQTGVALPPFINWHSTGGTFWLDGSSEYYDFTKIDLTGSPWPSTNRCDNPCQIYDSPGLDLGILYGFYDGQWQTYVRFTPEESGSIPVTLGRIDWSWDSVANTTNGVWQVTADSGSTPVFRDDDSFPQWTSVKPSPKSDN